MDLESLRTLFENTPAAQFVLLMAATSLADFVMSTIAHLKQGDFHGTLWGKWGIDKGLAIISVVVLFALSYVTDFVTIADFGDFDLDIFSSTAISVATSFIAAQGFSIVKNAMLFGAPVEQPVPEE